MWGQPICEHICCKNECWETFSLWFWISHCELMQGVNRFGPYLMDYGFSFTCSAQNLCFDVNWFYALLRFNCTSKPSLTSKPLLTIALKILKTIEKPLIPMVGPSKNIQWWWSNVVKTIEKPLKSMVAWKKTLTIPSLWKIDHRSGLSLNNSFLGNPPEQQRPLGGRSRSWRSVMVIVVLITLGDNHDSDLICLLWSMSCLWCLSLCSHKRWWTHSSRSSPREFRRLL